MPGDPELERVGSKKLELRVVELERTVKALVQAMKETEKEVDEYLMPEGEYFGTKFES